MNINIQQKKRLKKFISQTEKYDPDWTEEEKLKLFNHYHKRELNQFGLMIIQRVIAKKSYKGDTHRIILGSMVKYSDFNYSGINMKTVENVITFVSTAFKFFMIMEMEIAAIHYGDF